VLVYFIGQAFLAQRHRQVDRGDTEGSSR
jgi:hypothetical protein